MRRRTYLTALGGSVGVAGVGFAGLYVTDGESAAPPGEARRKVSLVECQCLPDESPVEFEVAVENPWITPSSTATLNVTTTNISDSEHRVQPAFYKGTSERSGNPGIVLYHSEAADFEIAEYEPPCFGDGEPGDFVRTAEFDEKESVVFTMELMLGPVLAPGESRTEELFVVDDPTVDGCFPPGKYRFEAKHTFDDTTIDWTWEIEIESVY